jgi:ABC-type Mn2+/Zn2+ transport system ATPase subunit
VPAVPETPALQITDLEFTYPGAGEPALTDLSLTVQPGERVALVGPNGAGKSTLIKLVVGLEPLRKGAIRIYGNPATACHHRVALVPQRTTVDWRFPVTVEQVVMMGRFVHLGWFRRPTSEDRDAAHHAMETMKIGHLAGRQVGELSGGQQQRVMLARTLAHEADLMLLDEPLNHVDVATQELIYHVLVDLSHNGRAVIVSTHDLGMLTVHFSRAVFLDRRLIADGPVDEVITPETITKSYGFTFHGEGDLTKWLNG